MVVGRLAPTPSGVLHLGNAVAFGAAWLSVRSRGGRMLLRIEDVDATRARPDLADGLRRDLAWLGLDWDEEVVRQGLRDYRPWCARLADTYRCGCTRKDLGGAAYPGTCRDAGLGEGALRWRVPSGDVVVLDRRFGPRTVDAAVLGDPVIQRRDGVYSYNLAVVADDIADGVTEVGRGADLLDQAGVQIRLWEAFGATPPEWLHAPLILGPDERKLAKSHGAMGIAALRTVGWTPSDVWSAVLPWLGVDGVDTLTEAVAVFSPRSGPRGPIRLAWDGPSCPRPRSGLSWFGTDNGEVR